MSIKTITKCAVWIYGSENTEAGWIENKVIGHGDGFKSQAEAGRWARAEMKRLSVPGKVSADRYKIGQSY